MDFQQKLLKIQASADEFRGCVLAEIWQMTDEKSAAGFQGLRGFLFLTRVYPRSPASHVYVLVRTCESRSQSENCVCLVLSLLNLDYAVVKSLLYLPVYLSTCLPGFTESSCAL